MDVICVTGNTSAELQVLIDRLRRGDDSARRELLQRAHDRLLKIASTLFHEDFPGLHGRHDLESVVSEVWIRLLGALEATQPQTVEGFFGLVFTKSRHVLLDMASRQRRHAAHPPGGTHEPGQSRNPAALDCPDTTDEPGKLALLTEFHERVKMLPDEERTVFELRYYGGFSQAEIAVMLERQPKQISRQWLAATGRLAQWVKALGGPG
jgi:RNA polymerase sigma factor (sigma-70 family)